MFYICYFTYIFHICYLNSSHPKDNATFSVLSAVFSVFIHRAGAGSMVGVASTFR